MTIPAQNPCVSLASITHTSSTVEHWKCKYDFLKGETCVCCWKLLATSLVAS